MSDRLPDNLATLYAAFSPEAMDRDISGDTYHFDGVEFVCKYSPDSTADRFFIVKPLSFVEHFVEFCQPFQGGAIVELGIAEGGSTVMLALVTNPRKLVAMDLEPKPLAALAEFAQNRGLAEVVRPYYGVDQADASRLAEIVEAEFAGEPLDLVLDDASHQLAETRASFEALFPHLRPGGVYTIEDWNADHQFRDAIAAAFRDTSAPHHEETVRALRESIAKSDPSAPPSRKSTLSELAVELVLACASSSDAVAEVTVNQYWVVVRRGPAELDPASFRLSDLYTDYFGFLPTDP